jgi:hypothetical protein
MQTEVRRLVADRAKRTVVDAAQRVGRLQTPMTQLLRTLHTYDELPRQLVALELFGMHGLWHTRDYVGRCTALDLYEINRTYAEYAARTLPRSRVLNADSIHAVNTGTLPRSRYNFIVCDNPVRGPFGPGYVEHFDLFPELLRSVDDGGILVLNFIHPEVDFRAEHARGRAQFYGKADPSVDEAAEVYRRYAHDAGLRIRRDLYTFRNATMGYLTLICEHTAQAGHGQGAAPDRRFTPT